MFKPEDFALCSWEKRKGHALEAAIVANEKLLKDKWWEGSEEQIKEKIEETTAYLKKLKPFNNGFQPVEKGDK